MSDSQPDTNQRPRFVAGAVCPSCHEQDRIVIDMGADERRCVACGYVEASPVAPTDPPATRVTRAAARRVETPPDPVKLIDG